MTDHKVPILGGRHLQTLLLFLAVVIMYATRQNASVSLVAMTDAKTTNPNFHEFNWNEKQKSYIQSSFFFGYTFSQIPGGYAARRAGVKMTLFIGIFTSSVLGLLLPICVFWGGWQIYCAIRILQGIFQGVLFPCIYQHLAKWSPVEERNRLGALSHSGLQCGMIVATYVTGMIAGSSLGWPGVFYVYSGVGIAFSLIWFIFAENTPAEAKFITAAERSYILTSQAYVEFGQRKKKIPVPWKALLTSGPLISLLVVRLCDDWGYDTMMSQVPAFLHGVLKMNITNNALYSTLPYVAMWVFSYIYMISADVVLQNNWTSLLVLRKTVNTISMWGPAALLIAIGFLDENHRTLTLIFMILTVGLNGGHTIGNLMNQIDLSPNHAGILMALLNSLASIVRVICPIVIGIIVNDETSRSQWQTVFIVAAAVIFLGNLQFLFFAQTKEQPWNDENFVHEVKIRETS
ncbi:putative inorganic phosphate cotransporter [Eupeodes corollae]|uniref:putative inorganic phosphate cotransporter n=1 Tax=Eupeodes corollae TaxID=290404 RepID=UPI0024911DCC|nr:putative inorganic phosphate cotransporter [Eupeodes corollae]